MSTTGQGGRFDRGELESGGESEFNAAMEEIDEELRADGIPIFARPLRSVEYVCRKGGFSLALHEPLWLRMSAWFDARYGSRLNVDLSLGYGPVLVEGDLYRLRVPWLIYGGRIVCENEPPPAAGLPLVNVLDLVEGLTDERKRLLGPDERAGLLETFLRRTDGYLAVRDVQNEVGYREALGDLQVASDCLFQSRPMLGNSRWHCLQAVEKFLKAWFAAKTGAAAPFTHDLARLKSLVEAQGLPPLDTRDVSAVQCAAAVRYDDSTCGPSDCSGAYDAALRICAHVAHAVASSAPKQARTETLPGKPLSLSDFYSLKAGDRLTTFGGMELEIVGVRQDSPRWYVTLVRGATRHTMIVEEDRDSFARVHPVASEDQDL